MFRSVACTFFLGMMLSFSVLQAELYAQDAQVQQADTTQNVVRVIRFVGNDNVKDNTLETLIRTHTNREFLGIPRFTPWYFIWKLTKRFGEPPAYLVPETVETDMERIRRYYESIGYLEASVDTNIVEFSPNKVEVSFLINEGQQSRVQTISYSGMPEFPDPELISDFYLDSEMTREPINDTTFSVNRAYSENALNNERNRIINFLKNNGYASVQRDSVLAQIKRDPSDNHQLDVLFYINPGNLYHFGDLSINLRGPDAQTRYEHADTLTGEPYTSGGKKIFLQKEAEAQTKFSLLTDQLLFKPGEVFDNNRYVRTVNEFQNLGMLNIREFGLSEDGSLPDYSKPEIPVLFSLQTLPKHSFNFNLFGLRRYGFGSGAGVTYTNNNLFGKAENLQVSLNGSFEYVGSETLQNLDETFGGGDQLFRSFEVRGDYSLPRLIFPFAGLDDNLFFSNSRTQYSLSLARSNQLFFDVNSDVRFNLRYVVNHNERFTSFLDLVELDVLDSDPSEQFRQSLIQQFDTTSFEYRRLLEDFRPQVSSILRYTFRSQNTDLIQRNRGYYSEYSVALGGNIPHLIDRYFVTPDTLEGNLPSPARISNNSLSYSRFLKLTADYRRYVPLSNDAVFSYRGFAGFAQPFGGSSSIPLNQRFFAGGSNDIRGWDFNSLGPGGIAIEGTPPVVGGEIKLVGQAEVRQTMISNFLSADWIGAWFTDAGNVWYGPRNSFRGGQSQDLLNEGKFYIDEFYKQIAVGSGVGLRLDWEYLVVRFDFAFRIHDLAPTESWFTNKKLYFSFGIGHSF
ncbi:BamA/TamA family outer membrane protein [Halalkalibaculum sp. DA384]|uniref:BamA/TamA family outer membrane protein n=1 Tax=Halalkalibaculum sp. DA384 TaxID=3373606 RepID=UPI0037543CD0